MSPFTSPTVDVRFVRRSNTGNLVQSASQCSLPLYPLMTGASWAVDLSRVGYLHSAIVAARKVADVLSAHCRLPAGTSARVCFDVRCVPFSLSPDDIDLLHIFRDERDRDGLLVVLRRLVVAEDVAAEWAAVQAEAREPVDC